MEEYAAGPWVQGAAEDMEPRPVALQASGPPGQSQLAVLASERPKSLAGMES